MTTLDQAITNYIVDFNGCHIYQGSITTEGYARFHTTEKEILLHRYVLEKKLGKKIIGDIDHVKERCKSRKCINPDHLEEVSTRTNVLRGDGITAQNARKELCSNGHEFKFRKRKGRRDSRYCSICQYESRKKDFLLAASKRNSSVKFESK